MTESEDITLVSPKSSRYTAGQRVSLKDGRSGRVIGIDPINGEYQIMTTDNRAIKVKSSDIEKLEKPKDSEYQESGVSNDDSKKLAIKDTPFNLDQDK